MKLNTHPENRKEMVRAISELTGLEATYMFTPTYSFQIGSVTVNRDGTIDCEDETMVETIKPMLIENGWLDDEVETEAPVDSKEIPEDTEPIRVAQMDITMPVENWTVSQLTNLLRMLYSKQYLITPLKALTTQTLWSSDTAVPHRLPLILSFVLPTIPVLMRPMPSFGKACRTPSTTCKNWR